jgi:hypothetical protein
MAQLYENPTSAKAYLQSVGFQRGAVRQWHDADDTQVEIKLLQFESPRLAKRFMFSEAGGERSQFAMTDRGKLGTAGDSLVLVDASPDAQGYALVEMFALKGNIVEEVIVWQLNRPKLPAATAIGLRQYARLP